MENILVYNYSIKLIFTQHFTKVERAVYTVYCTYDIYMYELNLHSILTRKNN